LSEGVDIAEEATVGEVASILILLRSPVSFSVSETEDSLVGVHKFSPS
jgi:hypothetical protein